jgi:hypothetical protein
MGTNHSNKAVTLRDAEQFAEWDAQGAEQTREYVSWHRAEAKRVKRMRSTHTLVHRRSGALISHAAPAPAPAPAASAAADDGSQAASMAEDDAAALAGSRLFAVEVSGGQTPVGAGELLHAAVDTAAEACAMLSHTLVDAASAAPTGAQALVEEGPAAADVEAIGDAGARLFASVVSDGGA